MIGAKTFVQKVGTIDIPMLACNEESGEQILVAMRIHSNKDISMNFVQDIWDRSLIMDVPQYTLIEYVDVSHDNRYRKEFERLVKES